MHPPTCVSYVQNPNTNTGSRGDEKLAHLSSSDHLLSSPLLSSIPQPANTGSSSGEAAPEPLLWPVNKRGDKTTARVAFSWCLQFISLFQTFKKVLWLSSSSPASSWADLRTPLWSCPGLSVGTHNQNQALNTVKLILLPARWGMSNLENTLMRR